MQQPLMPVFQHLEARRQAALLHFYKVTGLAVLATLAAMAVLAAFGGGRLLVGALCLLALLPISLIGALSRGGLSGYRSEFKAGVTGEIVRRIAPTLSYRQGSGMTASDYESSLLFCRERRFSAFKAGDMVQGHIAGVPLRFGEVSTQSEHRAAPPGNRTPYYKTIFRGVLVAAETGAAAAQPVVVFPGRAFFWRRRLGKDLVATTTGDPAFDRRFTVYAARQSLDVARLLPPERRAAVLALGQSGWRGLRLSFVGRRVFIAVPSKAKLAAAPILTSIGRVKLAPYESQMRSLAELPKTLRIPRPAAAQGRAA